MSIVSNNIKYLRRLNGLTQEQFARKIAIKRSLLGAYEEARANPNLTNLKNMAAAFGISVDNLLKNDLRKLRETPDMSLPLQGSRPMTVSHSGATTGPQGRLPVFTEPQPLSKIMEQFPAPAAEIRAVSRQVNLKPVHGEIAAPAPVTQPVHKSAEKSVPQYIPAVTQPAPAAQPPFPVFNNQVSAYAAPPVQESVQTVQWVPLDRQQEYLANFQNPAYLTLLPSFQLPKLASNYYRAFESGDDFSSPGSLLVGIFIRNWFDIQDGTPYIFVLRNAGIVYRKAFSQVKNTGTLILRADVPGIADMQVALQDVLEVWEIKSYVSTAVPAPQPSLERLTALIDELNRELDQLRNR